MIFDTITVIACLALAVLAVLSLLTDTFFRKVPVNEDEALETPESQPVSVVIIADNNADELRKNLPAFLSQDYPAGYEIIVAVEKDEDGTEDALKEYGSNPNLYSTFVPDSSRYMSRRKLAITLGVKAAKNERILLTDATCRPASCHWISSMVRNCGKNVRMVIGYGNYTEDAGSFKIFYRFHRGYRLLHEALHGKAYGMDGKNLMFSKSMFMAGNGFQGNLKYLRGEYDFLVNKYADEGNVAVELSPESFIIEEAPTKKEWRNMNVFYRETRRHLSGSLAHRCRFNVDMLSFHACLMASTASIVFSAIFHYWLILAFSILALLSPCISRTYNARKAMRQFGIAIAPWKIVPFEIRLIWQNLRYAIAYRFSDKYEFISHKS